MIAAITSDIGRAPAARVIAGAQSLLHRSGYLLILGAFDRTLGWDNISIQLQQRGIEGVIAIDVTLPRDLNLPAASVDLQDMRLLEPLSNGLKISLSKLGESAAETVLARIERKAVSPKLKLVPKPLNTYFDLAGADRSALHAQGSERA
jgi:DNA-binding LacI/PurR family transcriptional regulator